jgi:signal transduction histidine kinase
MFLVLALQVAVITAAVAQERGTATEAKALVEKGLGHIKAVGLEKASADFMDAGNHAWRSKDLYLFVQQFDGTLLAHGANKGLAGKNSLDLRDATGKPFVQDFLATAKQGSGWVDYLWTDVATKKAVQKAGYIARVPGHDVFVGCGIVKP